jgi:hypothetical protein
VLCSPKRKLIKEGTITMQRKGKRAAKQLQFFLFTDVIIYCTPTKSSAPSSGLTLSTGSSSTLLLPANALSSSGSSSTLLSSSPATGGTMSSVSSSALPIPQPQMVSGTLVGSPPTSSPPNSHLPLEFLQGLTPGTFVYKGVMWLSSTQVSLAGASTARQFYLSARFGDKQKTYVVTTDTADQRQEWVNLMQGAICRYGFTVLHHLSIISQSSLNLSYTNAKCFAYLYIRAYRLKGISSTEALQDSDAAIADSNNRRAMSPTERSESFSASSIAGGSSSARAATLQTTPALGLSRCCLNERPPASVVTINFDRDGNTRIRTSGMSNSGAIELSKELLTLLLQVLRKYAHTAKKSIQEAFDKVCRASTHTHTHTLSLSHNTKHTTYTDVRHFFA